MFCVIWRLNENIKSYIDVRRLTFTNKVVTCAFFTKLLFARLTISWSSLYLFFLNNKYVFFFLSFFILLFQVLQKKTLMDKFKDCLNFLFDVILNLNDIITQIILLPQNLDTSTKTSLLNFCLIVLFLMCVTLNNESFSLSKNK
jgi:hypothetical protein